MFLFDGEPARGWTEDLLISTPKGSEVSLLGGQLPERLVIGIGLGLE